MSNINSILDYLACPNDCQSLSYLENKLVCKLCKSEFNILNKNTIELTPKTQFIPQSDETKKLYSEYYSDLVTKGSPTDSKKRYWGIASNSIPMGFVKKSREVIYKNLENKIVFDIGAGMGDYSLHFAKKLDLVIHCDLNLEAIKFAREKAEKQNLSNIIFIRCDYMFLPFQNDSLPCVTCIDVLERGQEHDFKVIKQISLKLRKNGIFIADFHSKERTRLTHVENFGDRYSKNEIISIFSKNNLKILKIIGLGYIPQIRNLSENFYQIGNSICRVFLPPARWLIVSKA